VNENYTMSVSVDSKCVKILAKKFLAINGNNDETLQGVSYFGNIWYTVMTVFT